MGLGAMDSDWLLPELERFITQGTETLVAVNTVFHTIRFSHHGGASLSQEDEATELELCFRELLPCLEAMLILIRVRRDLFDKYTPLYSSFVCVMSANKT